MLQGTITKQMLDPVLEGDISVVCNLTYIVSFQPLYNQPSDTAVYHENKRRYVLFHFVSNYLFEVTIAMASHVVLCCNSGFN
jgi:hypothetical protein